MSITNSTMLNHEHQDKMNKLIQRFFYYWAPYVAYSLLAFDFALASYIGRDLISKRAFLFVGIFFFVFGLLGIHLYFCFRASTPEKKKEARFTLVFSSVVSILFVSLVEVLLPPLESSFTSAQNDIQQQLKRRNQVREMTFRGVTLRATYNDLGWADKPRDYVPKYPRIIFIGDSFLEVRSSKNLATITEQLLESMGQEVEVINLSKAGIGLDHYRYIFQEFSLELHPNHIFIFVYEGNDLFPGYVYTPYKHPAFHVTNEALAVLHNMGVSSDTKAVLLKCKRQQEIFTSKVDLFRALHGTDLSLQQKNLVYLTCYGYSSNCDSAPIFPKVFALLTKLAGKFIDYVRGSWNPYASQNSRPDILSLYPQFKTIFNRPRNERLEAIAKLFAKKYLLLNDYHRCLTLLESQEQQFISYLTEEVDMPFYLFQALEETLQGTILPRLKRPETHLIEQTTDEYMKLFNEIFKIANLRGISVTIVLIPEASYADEEFYHFWLPMLDFRKSFSAPHTLYLSLKKKLLDDIPVIDLGEFSHRFRDGYWKFDGHWNEKGNQAVSGIMAAYILHHRKESEYVKQNAGNHKYKNITTVTKRNY